MRQIKCRRPRAAPGTFCVAEMLASRHRVLRQLTASEDAETLCGPRTPHDRQGAYLHATGVHYMPVTLRFAGVRIGEATHPRPTISMPRDGNCLFHALAYWAETDQGRVRDTIARRSAEFWYELFPWDEGMSSRICSTRRAHMENGGRKMSRDCE